MMSGLPRQIWRTTRRMLGSAHPIAETPFRRIDLAYDRARWIVKIYYLASIYFSCASAAALHDAALTAGSWDLLWPARWLEGSSMQVATDWLTLAWILTTLLALQFERRVFRALAALALLQVAAISNSLGGTNHDYHAWLWIGVLFILLPDRPTELARRAGKMAYVTVIAGCQSLILLFYSMAGVWKIAGGLGAWFYGHEGNFSPNGLALTLSDRILQTGTSPLLANIVIENTWLSQPMFLGLIYAQFVALCIAFRPRLHLTWGYLLIGFNIGTWVLMEILFIQHAFLLGLLLVMSPFALRKTALRELLADLPWIGRVVRGTLKLPVQPAPGTSPGSST